MIRHVAMFKWNDDELPSHAVATVTALEWLTELITSIVSFRHGPARGRSRCGSAAWVANKACTARLFAPRRARGSGHPRCTPSPVRPPHRTRESFRTPAGPATAARPPLR